MTVATERFSKVLLRIVIWSGMARLLHAFNLNKLLARHATRNTQRQDLRVDAGAPIHP